MDRFLTIWSVVAYVEERLTSGLDSNELARSTGFSLAHLRQIFAQATGATLGRYMLRRRIANAAFDLLHTGQSALDIACVYGFQNPDTFTRAFRRCTGMTPQAFRKRRPPMARQKLSAGVYGVALTGTKQERLHHDMKKENNPNETILYGVPKVFYGAYHGCTPYPICLKANANYLGEDIPYHTMMVLCGAAFRLTWNTSEWDGGNVDIAFAFDDPMRSYRTGIEAVGREFALLWRTPETTKAEFIDFLRQRIDNGNPCIALGIIGPPEACIVTGYRDGGDTLLGWNFFQDNPEFGGKTQLDESGYFVCDDWWENPCTMALISVGEPIGTPATPRQVIQTAIQVLTGRQCGDHAKGIAAYDAWRGAIADDSQFPSGAVLPLLAERLMCHGDAMDCLADGRNNAARYLEALSQGHPQKEGLLAAAGHFSEVAKQVNAMADLLGGWPRGEVQMRRLNEPEARRGLCKLIDAAKEADSRGLDALRAVVQAL
ncbi:MAG: AraC family transcriptional regulator [Clostridia bacterium]|nr:AraC family transcriptional regulator [Clostridia bacterium]